MTFLKVLLEEEIFITQVDITSAYVYIELGEILYIMTLSCINPSGKVVKLNKFLCSLKQSGANWYKKIGGEFLLTHFNLEKVEYWKRVFINQDLIICLFVVDMIALSKKSDGCTQFL